MHKGVYIDFHTHRPTTRNKDVIAVASIDPSEGDSSLHHYFTAGIHPWNANIKSIDNDIAKLMALASNSMFIGVGEIGLDKLKGPRLEEQVVVFEKQVGFATSNSMPIVIHCVKAWDELLSAVNKVPKHIPMAIHGFNGTAQLAMQLVEKGFHLSVGSLLLDSKSKVSQAISTIPIKRLFLETDNSDADIEMLYQVASDKLNISMEDLKIQIAKNFTEFFNTSALP